MMTTTTTTTKTTKAGGLLLPLLLLLAAAAAAAAPGVAQAQLRVTGTTTVDRDRMAHLVAEGADGAALIWDVDREDVVDVLEVDNRLVLVGPPGVYRVKCRAIRVSKDGRPVAETARVTVTVRGAPPPPPPQPDPPVPPGPEPGPVPPTPAPTVKDLWILVVEETGEASERRGQWFADKDLAERIRSRGHRWRVVDKDAKDSRGAVPKDLAPWLERAKGKRLPRLFLIHPDGTVLHEGDAPATAKGLLEQIQKAGG